MSSVEPIDMSEFYFTQAKALIQKNKVNEAVQTLTKVIANSLVAENIAKVTYLKIEYKCKATMEDVCLTDIDYLISQHPESPWTGLSLRFLARYYENKQQFVEARSLNNIIKKNFSKLSTPTENLKL